MGSRSYYVGRFIQDCMSIAISIMALTFVLALAGVVVTVLYGDGSSMTEPGFPDAPNSPSPSRNLPSPENSSDVYICLASSRGAN